MDVIVVVQSDKSRDYVIFNILLSLGYGVRYVCVLTRIILNFLNRQKCCREQSRKNDCYVKP